MNDAIDTPFSGTRFFDALLSSEEYLERYHEYLRILVDEYVNGGAFDEAYERITKQIDDLVKTDPTAFYTYDEYINAAETLYETVKLRAESIDGQLNGTIPSTDSGQLQDPSNLVDASHIDIEAMGQFNMGGGFDNPSGARTDTPQEDDASSGMALTDTDQDNSSGNVPDLTGGMPDTGSFDPGSMPEGFGGGSMPGTGSFDPGSMPAGNGFTPPAQDGSGQSAQGFGSPSDSGISSEAQFPGSADGMTSSFGGASSVKKELSGLMVCGACFAVMIIALVCVSLYRRRRPL